jgi:hypothetical protein
MTIFADFLIVAAVTTTSALIWRSLLMDHPALLEHVEKLPIIGGVLTCGFCFTVWLSLLAVMLYNPLSLWHTELPALIRLTIGWFTLSAAVLFLRNLIAVLMEANGILSDKHQRLHAVDEK